MRGNESISQETLLKSYISTTERICLTVVFTALSVCGFIGNTVVMFVIFSLRYSLNVPTNTFMLSQAMSDFGTALCLVVYIIHMYVWIWDVFYWLTSIVWLASLGNIFFLTFNRFLSVATPLSYPNKMTSSRAKLLVVVNWFLSCIVTLCPLVIPQCPNIGRYYILVAALMILMCNLYLFRKAQIEARKIKCQNQVVTGLQVFKIVFFVLNFFNHCM